MPMAYAADRARISRSTLHKIERGDPGVSLGAYAAVLFGFGMIERLEQLVDKRWDWIGLAQDEERLPRRIRSARSVGGARPRSLTGGGPMPAQRLPPTAPLPPAT
jgi:hypothetical protein